MSYTTDHTFAQTDFTTTALPKGEYENCIFKECNLAETDLSDMKFVDCEFYNCNLSGAKLTRSVIRDVVFKDCKLLGLHFNNCNEFLFTASFENCQLNLSIFYKLKLKKTCFKNCLLREADFSETDLTQAVFENCDLALAVFENTVLEGADLRTAYNYSIDPEKNRIKKAKFSSSGIAGLLDKYNIVIE